MDTVKASKRDFSMNAKKLRQAGLIPGSVFGGPLSESISLQLNEADARKLVASQRVGSRLSLELDGQSIPVQLKEKEINSLNGTILHIAFQALKADQKVHSVVHILLENTDKVTDVLEHMITEIPYKALPADMIDTITINVDGMPVGTTVTVADIPELNNSRVEVLMDTDEIVYRIVEKKMAAEPDEEPVEE